jgi:hypothetical protein
VLDIGNERVEGGIHLWADSSLGIAPSIRSQLFPVTPPAIASRVPRRAP